MTDLDLRIGQETDAGRVRKYNEDYIECFVPANEAQLASKGAIFLVADGMGGHLAGEVASREAVKQVIQRYYLDESLDVGDCLTRAFKAANQIIHDMAQADLEKAGMGTTLVAAVILGRKLYVANVGDSRAYLLRRKRFRQITVDHSWVEEQVKTGTLTREQAEQHPQRNLITRALGTRPSVEVDLFQLELEEGDTLLLCTDGLNGQVSDRVIAQTTRSEPPPQAAAELVALASEQGGRDNTSVAIVQIGDRHEGLAWRQILDLPWLAGSRQRQIAVLMGLVVLCLCAMLASFPVANQRLAGNPAAAPQPAPIHFPDLGNYDLGMLATYLGYATLGEMKSVHPSQQNLENLAQADLSPAGSGVFVVGLVRNWNCQAQSCTFRLEMAEETYDIKLDPGFFLDTSRNLRGRRVRVYGQLSPEGSAVEARLVDLSARWWVWWQPAWMTVYAAHDWASDVWVYGIADQSPYSPIEMERYPTLQQGERILARGRWVEGRSTDPMAFVVQSLYRLENDVYMATSGGATSTPQPTVTLQPTDTESNP
jgi:serine/threonine protein phosphatase PrpC